MQIKYLSNNSDQNRWFAACDPGRHNEAYCWIKSVLHFFIDVKVNILQVLIQL